MSGLFPNIFRKTFSLPNTSFSRVCPRPTEVKPGPEGGYRIYKMLALFLGLPLVLIVSAYNWNLKHEECIEETRPPFIPYEHLRRHTKRWPWGDGLKSAFHNPKVNPLPDIGYEDEQ